MGSEKLPTQNQEACERIILRISKTATCCYLHILVENVCGYKGNCIQRELHTKVGLFNSNRRPCFVSDKGRKAFWVTY